MGQEFELSALLRDSRGCNQGTDWTVFSTGGSTREESAFKLTQFISLQLYDWRPWPSSAPRGCLQSPDLWPPPEASHNMAVCFCKAGREISLLCIKSYIMELNYGSDSLSSWHILLVEASHKFHSHSGDHTGHNTRGQRSWVTWWNSTYQNA